MISGRGGGETGLGFPSGSGYWETDHAPVTTQTTQTEFFFFFGGWGAGSRAQ